MSYNQQTFNRARKCLLNSGDDTTPRKVPIGAKPSLWALHLPNSPKSSYNEVYPGILIGDQLWVKDRAKMKSLGVTHIVNCAQGTSYNQINTDAAYYKDVGICFYGIKANDISSFDMTPEFKPAADFIDKALTANGKVFVHCIMGISRSASVVLAFLMLRRGMTLLEAVKTIRQHRQVFPNDGFLRQLCILDSSLSESKAGNSRG